MTGSAGTSDACRARRARTKAGSSDAPELVREIRRLVAEGHNARDIEGLLGIPRRLVHRIAKRNGITMVGGLGDYARRIWITVPAGSLPVLDRLSAEIGISRGEFLARVFLLDLQDGGKELVRRMGPLARPPRPYARQAADA